MGAGQTCDFCLTLTRSSAHRACTYARGHQMGPLSYMAFALCTSYTVGRKPTKDKQKLTAGLPYTAQSGVRLTAQNTEQDSRVVCLSHSQTLPSRSLGPRTAHPHIKPQGPGARVTQHLEPDKGCTISGTCQTITTRQTLCSAEAS